MKDRTFSHRWRLGIRKATGSVPRPSQHVSAIQAPMIFNQPRTFSSCCSACFMLMTNRILLRLDATAAATAGMAASGAANDAPKLR